MNKRILLLWSLSLLVFLPVAPAWTSGTKGPNRDGPQFSQDTWGCGLNLSAEQTRELRALQESFLQDTKKLRSNLKSRENELRALWDQRNPAPEKISAKQEEINALKAQLHQKASWYRMEAQRFLNPEQQAQLGAFPRGFESHELKYGMRGITGVDRDRRVAMGYGSCPRW